MKKLNILLFAVMLLAGIIVIKPTTTNAIDSKYTNFAETKIEGASNRGTNKNILGEFWQNEFAKKNKELLQIVGFSTNNGRYGYTEDWLPEYLQEEIKSVSDVMAYFYYSRYCYAEDDQGYMSSVFSGWNKQHSAKINIVDNCGVCCETAMVFNYLLEGDYPETGSIMVTSAYGHVYNYIKDWDGTYYLIDFTDFTSNEKDRKEEIAYKEWKDEICFWSGKSLKSPSCTKAVLIHDTYENDNCRNELSLDWNYKNTGWIVAVKYENGMEGAIASMLCDFSYQNTLMLEGVRVGNYVVRPAEFGCYFPKYTTYQTLWINSKDDGYSGARWVDGGTVALKLVPWYCDITPKAQSKIKETPTEKMKRQFNQNYFNHRDNDEVQIGTGWKLIMNAEMIDFAHKYNLSELEKILGFKLKEVK